MNEGVQRSEKLISVIVPVYNVEKYVSRCIESLIKQTYRNYEIIIINDGSTDRSGEICQSYSNRVDNIKIYHKENEGLGLARNYGIQKSKGEYITFVDSDDYVSKDFLLSLITRLEETSSDACIGGFTKVRDSGETIFVERYEENHYYHDGITNDILRRMLGSLPTKKDSIRMSVWNTLYKSSIIKENNIKFPSEREFISEDIIFDLYYYKHTKKVTTSNNVNYFYRYNEQSLSKKYNNKRFIMTNDLFKYLEDYLIYNNFSQLDFLRIYRLYFIYIRSCIKQEKYNPSNSCYKDALINIKKICNDTYLKLILSRYPIRKIGIKQKVFLYAIKYKVILFLYIFT